MAKRRRSSRQNPIEAGLPGYYGAFLNPLKEGDDVKAAERITRGDTIIVDKGDQGRVIGKGKFWGKETLKVRFMRWDGSTVIQEVFPEQVVGLRLKPNPGGRSNIQDLRKQPSTKPYPKHKNVKKRKIPVAQFESWLRNNGSEDEWRRYQKEKAAYKKFHKGAEPRFVTRKVVDVGAGKQILGRAFGYSMGKSPFEPYVTPKGSKKGSNQPYLHEYETMPEGVTNSSGKIIIKPLEGRTKITDWIYY